jgi:hypothetical protein
MKFTGALTWNSSGDLINEYVPGQRRWVGEPTPYLDAAWDGLEECKRYSFILYFSLSLSPSLSVSLYACHTYLTTIASLTSKPQSGPCCSKPTKPTMSAIRPSCKTDIGLPDSMCSTNCTVLYVKLRPFKPFIQLTHLIFPS